MPLQLPDNISDEEIKDTCSYIAYFLAIEILKFPIFVNRKLAWCYISTETRDGIVANRLYYSHTGLTVWGTLQY